VRSHHDLVSLFEHDLSENRLPPCITYGAGFFRIMLWSRRGSLSVGRNFGFKSRNAPARPKRENDLEGRQDMGGKQGGQSGIPKSPSRPHDTAHDEDVVRKKVDDTSR
jgi:hypothetical protein